MDLCSGLQAVRKKDRCRPKGLIFPFPIDVSEQYIGDLYVVLEYSKQKLVSFRDGCSISRADVCSHGKNRARTAAVRLA